MQSTKRLLLTIGFSVIFLALMLPGLTAWGQSEAKDLIINYVAPPVPNQASQTNEIRAYVSLLDAAGKPISGLTVDAFDISLFGQPVKNAQLAGSQDPMSVIVLLDTSGSMSGTPLDQAKTAAKQFIDTLGVNDEVALYSFNLTVTNHTGGFTPDKGAIKNLIGSSEIAVPKKDQWTCLYDALYEAGNLAIKRLQGRGAIIVLSDGGDIGPGKKQCSTHNLGDVVKKANGTLVPIYTIGLGNADLTTLQALADQTGGHALISPKPENLAGAFADLGALLKEQYVLEFKTGQVGSGPLQVSLAANPGSVLDVKQITILPPPTPVPLPPTVEFEGSYQNATNAFVFTATLKPNPTSNAEIADARWYVDNVQQGVITDTAAALSFSVVDSAGKCLVGDHALRIEATDAKAYKGEQSGTFTIDDAMCPKVVGGVKAPPTNVLPYLIGIGSVALLALVGVVFVMRKQSKAPVVYGENLSDKTEEAASDLNMVVAHLRLIGGLRSAEGKSEFSMSTDAFKIGRGDNNDLNLDDSKASRKHAEIRYNPQTRAFTIHDLGSSNGTKVNGEFFKATGKPLANGAHLEIGRATILFEATGERGVSGGTTDEDRTEMTDEDNLQ
jgi:VWFA-related protein